MTRLHVARSRQLATSTICEHLLLLIPILDKDLHVSRVRSTAVEDFRRKDTPPHHLSQVGVLKVGKPRPIATVGISFQRQEKIPQTFLFSLSLVGSVRDKSGNGEGRSGRER